MSSELLNVVVVGAASAGVNVATNLAKSLPSTHRVVLIEANPVAYWSIGALRASVLPGFETKVVHDLTAETVFGSTDSRHIVLAGTRVIDLQSDHIVVDKDVTASMPGSSVQERKTSIPVERVVLAIGADYGFPARISPSAKTKEDVLDQFRSMQNHIAEAKDILIVGGGPTGVEFAGEVLDVHRGKKVTLITRGPGLITNGKDNYSGLSAKLISQLESKGVRVILNDSIDLDGQTTGPLSSTQTFKTGKGEQLTADFLLIGSGGKPHTQWISHIDPDILDSSARIKVSPHFSIESSSPRWSKYYAVGDAASTPGPKVSYMAGQHAPQVAHNVVCDVKGEKQKMKVASPPSGDIIMVPVGKSGGAGYLMFFSVGGWPTSLVKGKSLFVSMFEGWFRK
ncbi:Pyr_redox_2 domain-containing protein [Pseudozyma hubeiensis]|nr:Pyr_redox_2 domain-containing protein [Pseudozyma hubeiensis]